MIMNQAQRDRAYHAALATLESTARPTADELQCFFPIRAELAAGIEEFLPSMLTVRINPTDPSCIALDGSWAQNVLDYVSVHGSKQEINDMAFRLNKERWVAQAIVRNIEGLLQPLMRLVLTAATIRLANNMIHTFVLEHYHTLQCKERWPALDFKSVLRHALGIKSCVYWAYCIEGKYFQE